jgi:hypothetical protein
MIEINPLFVILFFEAILILILLALIVPILRNKTNNATQSAALTLVKKLEKNEGSRVERLEQLLAHFGDTNPVLLSEFLEEIKAKEKNFYQHVLRMFFSKDPSLLKKMDKQVESLSEPYFQLLSSSSVVSNNADMDEELQLSNQEVSRLKNENQAFSEQLEIIMNTIDEISSEYTRIFAGTRTEMELKNSSKKMIELFRTSGQSARTPELPAQMRK